MSQVSTALAAGFAKLQDVGGEVVTVTIGGTPLSITVPMINRTPSGAELGSEIQVSTLERSIVEFPLGYAVEPGHTLIDEDGFRHTVQLVTNVNHAQRLICGVSR